MMPLCLTIWVIGWMYALGTHNHDRTTINKLGDEETKSKLKKAPIVPAALILFLFWPHFLGYGKND